MSQRVSYYEIAPEGMKIMMDMEKYTKQSSINRTTRELIKIRVSNERLCLLHRYAYVRCPQNGGN
ncbi:uncharacterized protein S101441_00604 [Bacillus subtilis subsp. subtilis]|nr:uncharacterized protein S101441_00604 [Bacillus subtilis subsp. subtilis]